MKKTQRLTAVFLLLLILCGCSTLTAPDTIVMPQTSAETRTEPAPVSAEPEPGVFHPEYEQTALPEPLSAVTALTVLDGTFFSDVETYISDHFACRVPLLRLNVRKELALHNPVSATRLSQAIRCCPITASRAPIMTMKICRPYWMRSRR